MNFYFYFHSIKFKNVLNEMITNYTFNTINDKSILFITENYNDINKLDELLVLDPEKKYYSEINYIQDNKLYGEYDDWEDYWDSVYQ